MSGAFTPRLTFCDPGDDGNGDSSASGAGVLRAASGIERLSSPLVRRPSVLRFVADDRPRRDTDRQEQVIREMRRAAQRQTERRSDRVGACLTDPRWLLAERTARALQGSALPLDSRQQLLKLANQIGLRPFDANMVIAIVQDQARCQKLVTSIAGKQRANQIGDDAPSNRSNLTMRSSFSPKRETDRTPVRSETLRPASDDDEESVRRTNGIAGFIQAARVSSARGSNPLRYASSTTRGVGAEFDRACVASSSSSAAALAVAQQNRESVEQLLEEIGPRLSVFDFDAKGSSRDSGVEEVRRKYFSDSEADRVVADHHRAMFWIVLKIAACLALGVVMFAGLMWWFFLPPAV